jgi:hypothetical protein
VRLVTARHSGSVLGLVLVERSAAAERFAVEDERTLTEVGRGLGVVLHNRRLDAALQATLDDLRATNAELQASRARIVAAADAERRRIERDIHDGAQQHLVALAVGINLARDLVGSDPEAATELLGEAVSGVHEAIQQVRDLAHGIYPPCWWRPACPKRCARRPYAARCPSRSGSRAERPASRRHRGRGVLLLPRALQNAAKHATGVSEVTGRRPPRRRRLHFTVPTTGPASIRWRSRRPRLRNMADRVGAVGGRVTWEAAAGRGTTVSGVVPLPGSRRDEASLRGAGRRPQRAAPSLGGLAPGRPGRRDRGATATGAAVLERRTATAYDRLDVATGLDDARILAPTAAAEIPRLPPVRSAWAPLSWVGAGARAVGAVPQPHGGPATARGAVPADRAGRSGARPRGAARGADRRAARAGGGLRPGSVLELALLTAAEVEQFDTGFGEPDGPRVTLTVTGIARLSSWGNGLGYALGRPRSPSGTPPRPRDRPCWCGCATVPAHAPS